MKILNVAAALVMLLFGCASPEPQKISGEQSNANTGTAGPAHGEGWEKVQFPSLDSDGMFGGPRLIDGYLFRPAVDGPRPAVVFLHGCGGLLTRNGAIGASPLAWAKRLAKDGYVVLIVDSFSPRGITSMCAPANYEASAYLARPKDAYGALSYLQSQSFVRPDRIGLIGWSEGGGAVLLSINDSSLGRPAELPHGDFRAAVAFYPASCDVHNLRRHKFDWWMRWSTQVPLLVLMGDQDVWTPVGPCKDMMDGAVSRGSPVELHIYPGAYHAFDAPGHAKPSERPEFTTRSGVVPITGPDPAARSDAYARVPEFLARYLGD
jgi:dienelactone hydrolase